MATPVINSEYHLFFPKVSEFFRLMVAAVLPGRCAALLLSWAVTGMAAPICWGAKWDDLFGKMGVIDARLDWPIGEALAL